uniref:Uncharacterized protein n=1 Tax=Romanomermis culicivorax TaxID=13658 RepID=A0A915KYC6_ROMCU
MTKDDVLTEKLYTNTGKLMGCSWGDGRMGGSNSNMAKSNDE